MGNGSYTLTFLQAFSIEFGVWVTWCVVLWPRFFSPFRHLPSPKGNNFFMGQWFRLNRERLGDPMKEWINEIPNDGLICYRDIFNQEILFVTTADAHREILTTKSYDFEKPLRVGRTLAQHLGLGLLFSTGDMHRFQRHTMLPAFAFRHIKDLYPIFWSMSKEAIECIAIEAQSKIGIPKVTNGIESTIAPDQSAIEVVKWWKRVTLDIIGLAGMGQDFGARKDSNSPLYQAYRAMSRMSWQSAVIFILPEWAVNIAQARTDSLMDKASEVIRARCRELIHIKTDKMKKNQLTEHDILSVAIQSGGFSQDQLLDQLMNFLVAGHETVAVSMTWAVYALCQHPGVQTKLRAEVREHLPSPAGFSDVSSTDIDKMPYLNAVCSEVFRFYPILPRTLREAIVDTSIAGFPVPKGSMLILVPSAVHRSREMWGDRADTFDPERWIESPSGGAKSNYAFQTFLQGPRACIGTSFARGEFACLLAGFVGRFEFELNDAREMEEKNFKVSGGITVGPVNGLDVKLRVVEGW